ncbi:MAG: DUF3369 domain-containing protein [Alphaproteobacteria bacterium]|nr:DUF3369 domain-containing protein [Alphaproteobacteria bacterium]
MSDDAMEFADETEAEAPAAPLAPWQVLVVDDDADVHRVTLFVLKSMTFDGRPLEVISAMSARQAREILAAKPGIALAMIDVVMETEHAGLDLVRWVRGELGNRTVRLVLRTGQPGQAPETQVVAAYDINDYKTKEELTTQKLFTLVHSSLRSYRDIVALDRNRSGLRRIIDSSATIFEIGSMNQFAGGVLDQLTALLDLSPDAVYCEKRSLYALCDRKRSTLDILAGAGEFAAAVGKPAQAVLPPPVLALLDRAVAAEATVFDGPSFATYRSSDKELASLLHARMSHELSDLDRDLIELFSRNVAIAFHNLQLRQDVEETQREIVYRLCDLVETRSNESGNHIRRMARYARMLGEMAGLSERDASVLEYAAPLHDLGKIGIPDRILNKPGKLDGEEWEIMKTHAQIGHTVLSSSDRPILRAGAVIALEHHERWDGAGYPQGKAGEAIDINARICALADVFDALGTRRAYKDAWSLDRIMEFLGAERGRIFDPGLVDLLVANLDSFATVRAAFPEADPASAAA